MIDGDDETRRANARLIVAAPDMLDELKSILAVLEGKGIAPKRQETIRVIIAKADHLVTRRLQIEADVMKNRDVKLTE